MTRQEKLNRMFPGWTDYPKALFVLIDKDEPIPDKYINAGACQLVSSYEGVLQYLKLYLETHPHNTIFIAGKKHLVDKLQQEVPQAHLRHADSHYVDR